MEAIISNLQHEVKMRSDFAFGLHNAVDSKKRTIDWRSETQVNELETLREHLDEANRVLRSLRAALVCMRQARGDKNIDVFYPENF